MLRWTFALVVFPILIYLHLRVAPYTKVEESFNVQAVHDILTYGIPNRDVGETFKAQYDHMTFPGAVPRTFIGALLLAGFARPVIWVNKAVDRQQLVRGILGVFSAASLVTYAIGVRKAFGSTTGLWYIALQASQFHIVYYASRTLPNMFAFGISTLALRFLLPDQTSSAGQLKRVRLAFYLITLATIIFRSELALLLASHSLYILIKASETGLQSQIAIIRQALLPAGILGTLIGLALSIPIDTFFWQSATPLWPELSAFLSNVFPSESNLGASAWGTSPWHWYITSALPRLLLNPLSLPLLAYTLTQPATRHRSLALLVPSLTYVGLYSILPHKETRFLFPVLPPLTAATALAASYITNGLRRQRSLFYRLATYAIILSTAATFFLAHIILLPLSAISYPGAHALNALHQQPSNNKSTISVHLDNLALQTGITRFQQMPPPIKHQARNRISAPPTSSSGMSTTHWLYDKSDDPASLLDARWWAQFDYAVMEEPGLAIGAWEVVDRVYGLGTLKLLRPDQERGPTKPDEGLAAVIGEVYGPSMTMLYCLVKDVVREGYGLQWLGGMREDGDGDGGGGKLSWTGGWWVDVGLVEKLFVLRRVESVCLKDVGES